MAKRRNRIQIEVESIAYHEAGHAVAAVVLRTTRPSTITIDLQRAPRRGTGRESVYRIRRFHEEAIRQLPNPLRGAFLGAVRKECTILVAGLIGSKMHSPRRWNAYDASEDYKECERLLAIFYGDEKMKISSEIKKAENMARRLFRIPLVWEGIEYLTSLLLVETTIERRRLQQILSKVDSASQSGDSSALQRILHQYTHIDRILASISLEMLSSSTYYRK